MNREKIYSLWTPGGAGVGDGGGLTSTFGQVSVLIPKL